MTVLYLIVARGGSKRLPGKNLREIQGITLVGYKCLAAKRTKSCTLAMISTDSPQIADVARQYGVTVPFIRPAELATDTAATEDVVRHAMAWCEENNQVHDAIQLLEPSSPFVSPCDYDKSIEMKRTLSATFISGDVLYLFSWDYLKVRADLYSKSNQCFVGYGEPVIKRYFMSPNRTVDIDTLEDFNYAKFLAEKGYVDLSWSK